jgi:hypothetical protein
MHHRLILHLVDPPRRDRREHEIERFQRIADERRRERRRQRRRALVRLGRPHTAPHRVP